jgi:FKBP-type peptidyl-prolyl cis-trans isomerase (trigger factor)
MKIWEIVDNKYFVNVDNITFIDWNGKNEDGKNEFTVGFTSGKSQGFTTGSTQEEFAEEIAEQLMGKTKKEEVGIASSEELSKPEPAWRTILEE